MRRALIVGFLAVSALCAASPEFERLKTEAARAKAILADEKLEDQVGAVSPLHAALHAWVESRLPEALGSSTSQLHHLAEDLQAELQAAGVGLAGSDDYDHWETANFGKLEVDFKWLPELPDALVVVEGAGVRCGMDDAVYFYQFQSGKRTLVLEDHRETSWGHAAGEVQVSEPDSQGRRLVLTSFTSAQCASAWMRMAYSVNRLDPSTGVSHLLVSEEHDFWLNLTGPLVLLEPDRLTVEFLDSSVDGEVHNRTRVHIYNLANEPKRVDPVALQPQDFAEEWLTRPWSEMTSRSSQGLELWHQKLHGEFVLADYASVVSCSNSQMWSIGLVITHIGETEITDPSTSYFLVRDLGNYRYRMDAVSITPPAGCTGVGIVSDYDIRASLKHPWLSTKELEELR